MGRRIIPFDYGIDRRFRRRRALRSCYYGPNKERRQWLGPGTRRCIRTTAGPNFLTENLYDEHEKLVTLDDAQHLYREVFRQNGMVYCRSFASQEIFPWLDTFIRSSHCSVLCNKKGKPLALLLRKGNHRRWIVLFKTWEMKPDMHSVHILRQAFDHIDAGVAPTPGGLGRNIMRQVWHQYRLPVHTSPSGHCEQYIREHMCGGRVDTPGLGCRPPMLL